MNVPKLKNYDDPVLDRQIQAICTALSPTKLGTTTARPKLDKPDSGYQYFDTTLSANGKPIWWTGAKWVDYAGTAV